MVRNLFTEEWMLRLEYLNISQYFPTRASFFKRRERVQQIFNVVGDEGEMSGDG